VFTATLLFAMWVKTIWTTEQLERPKHTFDLAIAPAPPPPPAPLAGGEKPVAPTIVPKKPTVRTIVQPVKLDTAEVRAPDSAGAGDPHGDRDGARDGAGSGSGVVGEHGPPIELPTPAAPRVPRVVPPAALEATRIAGEPRIVPDDVTKTSIQRAGRSELTGTFKLCLTSDGAVASVTVLRPTGFDDYDRRITSTIQREWRYRPFVVDGQPAPVCTAVTFRYSQR
jgi:protein TonB